MKINPESLARASSRHPWRVIGSWVVLFLVMGGITGALLSGVLNNDISFTNKPESIKAQDVIDAKFAAKEAGASTEYVIVQSSDLTVDDADFQNYVKQLQGALAARTDLVTEPPATYYDVVKQAPDQAAGLVSQDKSATLIPVAITEDNTETIDGLRTVIDENASDAFTTQLAGQATLNADFTTVAEEDARKGESIGIVVALIVLVVVFGAIIAALLPIGVAIMAIVIALGITSLVGPVGGVQPLRHQHHLDDRSGGGHRLLLVHRVPLPRRAEEGVREARRDRRGRRHGEPGGVLQRHDGGPRLARDVHHPHHDLPCAGIRSDLRDPGLHRGFDDAVARDAGQAR